MGKKVRKYKNVEIVLEPDGFSIHTIEFSRYLKPNGSKSKAIYTTIMSNTLKISSIRMVYIMAVISVRNMQKQVYAFV